MVRRMAFFFFFVGHRTIEPGTVLILSGAGLGRERSSAPNPPSAEFVVGRFSSCRFTGVDSRSFSRT